MAMLDNSRPADRRHRFNSYIYLLRQPRENQRLIDNIRGGIYVVNADVSLALATRNVALPSNPQVQLNLKIPNAIRWVQCRLSRYDKVDLNMMREGRHRVIEMFNHWTRIKEPHEDEWTYISLDVVLALHTRQCMLSPGRRRMKWGK